MLVLWQNGNANAGVYHGRREKKRDRIFFSSQKPILQGNNLWNEVYVCCTSFRIMTKWDSVYIYVVENVRSNTIVLMAQTAIRMPRLEYIFITVKTTIMMIFRSDALNECTFYHGMWAIGFTDQRMCNSSLLLLSMSVDIEVPYVAWIFGLICQTYKQVSSDLFFLYFCCLSVMHNHFLLCNCYHWLACKLKHSLVEYQRLRSRSPILPFKRIF